MYYPGHEPKTSDEIEKPELGGFDIQKLRKAAEVHRQVRSWVQSWIKPGIPMIELTDHIEDYLAFLIEKEGLKAGQAFP
eukprot:CAMPEP_0201511128 /NCGR_PEP_ID=MMETSP0161_2-20130828/3625_1 /ASSEMBLY_ACC=CAM_ASM_000251 /TAXON_ID=180227 /ORGANISM="Neoparamoeba aestuarina, Strain SoJaBio B1-5/56/2" /LENGTH=78 /DNA_ID=CAMNT_0047906481 /DNA_START=6 /DNA_END=238 /DNA_ORIENTATION=+